MRLLQIVVPASWLGNQRPIVGFTMVRRIVEDDTVVWLEYGSTGWLATEIKSALDENSRHIIAVRNWYQQRYWAILLNNSIRTN